MNDIRYMTIKQIVESPRYPFTIRQIRYYIMMRNKNGLFTAVRKIGKRLYLRTDLFEQWIESNRVAFEEEEEKIEQDIK